MIDAISLSGLLVALTLPWLCGCIWVHWLLRRTGRCNAFVVLGQGYFLGLFITTLVIRLWDRVGLHLNFWGIAAVVATVSVAGLLLQRLRPVAGVMPAAADAIPRWHVAVGMFFVALIAWRHVTLLEELLLRPLYAWDAWMNWAPKAIVWLHHGTLVNFVSPDYWLAHPGQEAYTLGNREATTYPLTVPLIQLWVMLGIGTWDNSAVYLPWLLAPLALGLALYGHLRVAGVPWLLAVFAAYLLLSLPYLNVHTVLAGYADSWLAASFALGVCALYEYRLSRHGAYAFLLLALALLCSQLKEPGIVLALILIVCGARVWLNVGPKLELVIWGVVGALIAGALVFGVSTDLPYLGRIALDSEAIELGNIGRVEFEQHNVLPAFITTFFVMINWHLLWYLVLPWVAYRLFVGRLSGAPPDEVMALLGAMAFVAVIFVFSKYYVVALNFVTLNRALLYPVPALIFCMFLSFQKRISQSQKAGDGS